MINTLKNKMEILSVKNVHIDATIVLEQLTHVIHVLPNPIVTSVQINNVFVQQDHMINLIIQYAQVFKFCLTLVCHETCLTCNGSKSNQCQTCNTQIKRQLNDLNECVCSSKYYDAGLQECQACSIYCLNCVSTADKCLSCKIDRYLQDNACLCLTKLNGAQVSTYQAQGQSVCQSCHYSCLNCNGPTANKCTSCLDSEQRYC